MHPHITSTRNARPVSLTVESASHRSEGNTNRARHYNQTSRFLLTRFLVGNTMPALFCFSDSPALCGLFLFLDIRPCRFGNLVKNQNLSKCTDCAGMEEPPRQALCTGQSNSAGDCPIRSAGIHGAYYHYPFSKVSKSREIR